MSDWEKVLGQSPTFQAWLKSCDEASQDSTCADLQLVENEDEPLVMSTWKVRIEKKKPRISFI